MGTVTPERVTVLELLEAAISRENSERKLAEDELREREARIRRLEAELATRRVKAKRAEEQLLALRAALAYATRVSTLGELSASIAHEVGQPPYRETNNRRIMNTP